jgi:aminopeptidase N
MPGSNLARLEAQARAAIGGESTYEIELDLTTGLTDERPTFRSTTTLTFAAEKGTEAFLDLIAHAVHSTAVNATN